MSEANSLARRAHVAELVIAAREARLEGVELLDGDTDALAAEYNGIGPEFLPDEIRDEVTRFLALFEPAALIHDLRYSRADGSREGFETANMEFHGNCLKLARAKYPWWRFVSRRVAEKTAFALYKAVSSYFGWVAYRRACKLHASKNVAENAANPQNPPIS